MPIPASSTTGGGGPSSPRSRTNHMRTRRPSSPRIRQGLGTNRSIPHQDLSQGAAAFL
ncbi:hypothetical protein SETIT_7G335100v2 [Setaria italica]|uniref:Uncharacterized protein n=1 Tax=Setaria italica TaxID=4555 RepID=A0A368S489_SETIT|nr:hypothetical protein SETIT_7G335100v2 [Setaria italica]